MEIGANLSKYYFGRELKAVVLLLKTHGLFDELQASTQRFYGLYDCKHQPVAEAALQQLLGDYLRIVFECMHDWTFTTRNFKTANAIFLALTHLINEAGYFSNTETNAFNKILDNFLPGFLHEGITKSWKQISLYYNLILVAPYNLTSALARSETNAEMAYFTLNFNRMQGDAAKKIDRNSFAYDIIVLFKQLKSESAILALFDQELMCKTIRIKRCHLEAFLVLFGLLCESGRITCSPRKGLYCFLKSRLIALGKDELPKRSDFSKIRSEALANAETRAYLKEFLYDFLKKYLPPEKFQIIFQKYFADNQPPS